MAFPVVVTGRADLIVINNLKEVRSIPVCDDPLSRRYWRECFNGCEKIVNLLYKTGCHSSGGRGEFIVNATLVAALVMLVALAPGCSSDIQDDETPMGEIKEERARHGNLVHDGLEVEKADLNGSGEADQWMFYNPVGQLVRVERDMNFDGNVDMWQYYDEDGELIEEEMSLDATPNVDVVVFYENGRVTRKLMASRFDGSFPIEQFFGSDGKLLRVERDASNDGRVDVWEYYDGGERTRIGWDTTGDGHPDTFDQY